MTEREKELAVLIVELSELATNGSSEWAATHRKAIIRRARHVVEGFPEAVQAGEDSYRAFCATDSDHEADGTSEGLATVVRMIDTWGPETLPANENGQVHFARAMLDSAAAEIRAFLAKQPA